MDDNLENMLGNNIKNKKLFSEDSVKVKLCFNSNNN